MAVLAQFFWRYYLQNKVMAVLAQFYFGVLAALAQLAVLAQFYFGVSIDPPQGGSIGNGGSGAVLFWSLNRPAPPPWAGLYTKIFFSFPPKCSQCKHNEIQRVGQQFWLTPFISF